MPIVVNGVKIPNNDYRRIAASAERGAKFLDTVAGKWFNRVKTTQLNMQDSCNCIYGQLDKDSLLNEIEDGDRKGPPGLDPRYASQRLGYTLPDNLRVTDYDPLDADWNDKYEAVWSVLQEEWLRQIKIRRDVDKAIAKTATTIKNEIHAAA